MMYEDDEVVIVKYPTTSAPSKLKERVAYACQMLFCVMCVWIVLAYFFYPTITHVRVVRCNGIGPVAYIAIIVFSLIMAAVYGWASSEKHVSAKANDATGTTNLERGIFSGGIAFCLFLVAGYFSWLNTAEIIECNTAGPYQKYHAVVETVRWEFRMKRLWKRTHVITFRMSGEFEGSHKIHLTEKEDRPRGRKWKWKEGDRIVVYAKRGKFGNMLVPMRFNGHKRGVYLVQP